MEFIQYCCMGCTVCDSSDHQFTSSNLGACFPPFDTRVCVTLFERQSDCSCGLISEEELSHEHCSMFCFSDFWDEQKYIYGAALFMIFNVLLPLNLKERPKFNPHQAEYSCIIPHDDPKLATFSGCLFDLDLNNLTQYISTCLQKGSKKSIVPTLLLGAHSLGRGPCERGSTSNAAKKKSICLLDTLHSYV